MHRTANVLLVLTVLVVLVFLGGRVNALVRGFSGAPPPHEPPRVDAYAGLSPVELGEMLFATQGCRSCHQLGLVGGPIGPSLSNVGVRRSQSWLREHFLDPQALVPGNDMPSYAFLSDRELDGLVAYLKTLDGSRTGPETEGPVRLDPPARFAPELVARGQEVLRANGCLGCHRIGDEGVALGPNLTHEGLRGRTDAWQKQHLQDPLSVYVFGPTAGINWPMPPFAHLSEEDLDALVAYLQSLR